MTTTATRPSAAAAPVPADLRRSALPLRRRMTDGFSKGLMGLALLIALIPLGLVIYHVTSRGIAVLDWDFIIDDIPNSARRAGGGMGPAVAGTLLITGAAAAMAIPLGVLGSIYLNEYGKQNALARLIRTMADVMTGVPSVVMGLFIYVSYVLIVKEQSGFAAALALGCLMLPVIIRSSEEMLRLVPDELRQASAALGARRWKTTVSVVLPAAISGIVSGVMLAIARAAGETAPVVLVAGTIFTSNWTLDGANTTLAAQIFKNAGEPFPAAQERAWGAALTLMVIVLVFTVVARLISSRFAIKER
ncbi:phosphate transport system permease protein PstA [Catellatospora methionotrophica]|uniref:Phosphate transport system permease protein PstA n=1 Tax=Catellatospora methionotrophica TaxID=121620 RepID=A0A8J3LG39_9ACTN|nr:phosphate ABC transporter permease PstA [Catellatospora methionotrophica]GIG17683.1 phosphate transport system permease protein PstA [Catellatospora methionotrophica]